MKVLLKCRQNCEKNLPIFVHLVHSFETGFLQIGKRSLTGFVESGCFL